MNPCPKNREPLSLLALGELEEPASRELRSHAESCVGCRNYLEEISSVAQALAAEASSGAIRPDRDFERKVARAIEAEARRSWGARVVAEWRDATTGWRILVPAGALAALAVASWIQVERQPANRHHDEQVNQSSKGPKPEQTTEPSLAVYDRAASESLEALDKLLAREAARSVADGGPVYTAALLGDRRDLE